MGVFAAIGAVLLMALTGKAPKVDPGDNLIATSEKLSTDIEEIQVKSDADIIKDHVSDVQKANISDVVDAQVEKAMDSASKYKRKKP